MTKNYDYVDKGQMVRTRRGSLPALVDQTPRGSRSRTRSMSIDTSQSTVTLGSRESTPTGEKPLILIGEKHVNNMSPKSEKHVKNMSLPAEKHVTNR